MCDCERGDDLPIDVVASVNLWVWFVLVMGMEEVQVEKNGERNRSLWWT